MSDPAPHAPSGSRYRPPKWSLKATFFGGLAAIAVTFLVLHFGVEQDIWRELEQTAALSALALTVFFTVAFYRGVRILPRERLTVTFERWKVPGDSWTSFDPGLAEIGAEGGILGIVAGIVLSLVVSIVVILLVATLWWAGVNAAVVAYAAVVVPLFALFRRSVRTILTRGRRCRGELLRSMAYGLGWGAAYGAWFYAMLLFIRLFLR